MAPVGITHPGGMTLGKNRTQNIIMKIKKILFFSGLGLVLLVMVAVIIVALCLDGIVKTGVQTVGPKLVQVPITLDNIHIGVLSGSAKVKGLVVGNPDGYKSPFAVSVGLAEVSADVASALSDKIVIHAIHVESPEISFEGGLSKNNLFQIRDNLNAVMQGGGTTDTNAQAAVGAKPAKKIEVDDFLITGAKVHVILTALGGQEMTLPLPDIHLTDLGKGDAGLTPADLTSRILGAITSSTLQAVTGAVSNLGKDARKAATGTLNKIGSGLGNLFK